jgi:hypothetical protein
MTTRAQPSKPMRFTIPLDSAVVLYPHEPLSLVPLLRKHLPKSLPVLSTILENASFSSSNFTKSSNSIKEEEEGYDYDTVFATFPSVDKVDDQDIWAVIVQMSEFDSIHLRFYCSAEIEIPRPLGPPHPRLGEGEAEETIRTFVMGVTESVVRIFGKGITLGAISSRWNEAMRSVVDARELVECAVFLAPHSVTAGAGAEQRVGDGEGNGVGAGEGRGDVEVLDGMGLMVDRARDEDMAIVCLLLSQSSPILPFYGPGQLWVQSHSPNLPNSQTSHYEKRRANPQIQSTCDVPRPLAYYASRSSQSTVIRHKSTGEAVCWIILHADGSIGALYTIPTWRRKGLAEIVVRHNITSRQAITKSSTQNVKEKQGKEERRDFCYVFKGNTASERLWVKMGWEEGWGVKWIVNRKVEEARGKVERFSHPDE